MKVFETMSSDLVTVRPETTLQEAVVLLQDAEMSPLPVCDGDRPVGMLTERDVEARRSAGGWRPWATRVGDVMKPEVICCFDSDDVQEAADFMQRSHLRRLVVVDRGGRLAGILCLGDTPSASAGTER